MRISFVTTNRHKVAQARKVLGEHGIKVDWVRREYDESSDDTIEQIAAKAAASLSRELKRPVVVEDTGVFFDAYPGFPGAMPKFVFTKIGYEGIFRLLRGKSKKAKFVSCVAYCKPGRKPKLFRGAMKGRIILKVKFPRKDVLPYERIFVADSHQDVLAAVSEEEKLKKLHRIKAMRKLGTFLKKQ